LQENINWYNQSIADSSLHYVPFGMTGSF